MRIKPNDLDKMRKLPDHLAIKRLSQSKLHSTEARKAFAANFFSRVMLVVNYHLGEEKKENPNIFAGRRNRFCCS